MGSSPAWTSAVSLQPFSDHRQAAPYRGSPPRAYPGMTSTHYSSPAAGPDDTRRLPNNRDLEIVAAFRDLHRNTIGHALHSGHRQTPARSGPSIVALSS